MKKKIRKPIVNGIFYPDDNAELKQIITSLLSEKQDKKVEAITIPHAAYEFIQDHIGDAFSYVKDRKIKKILIFAPVHREFNGQIWAPNSDIFRTPIGDIDIDREEIDILEQESPIIQIDDTPHEEEHSIELILPFIKYLYPKAKIIPLLTGGKLSKQIKSIKKIINSFRNRYHHAERLIITSSNLTEELLKDTAISHSDRLNSSLNEKGTLLTQLIQDKKISPCGLAALSALHRSELKPVLLKKSFVDFKENSKEKSVGYGSFIWTNC